MAYASRNSDLASQGVFVASFPLPDKVKPGQYRFGLTVNTTETRKADPTKKLSASNLLSVTVVILKNPRSYPEAIVARLHLCHSSTAALAAVSGVKIWQS